MPARNSEGNRVLVSGLGPVSCLGLGLDALAAGAAEMAMLQTTRRAEGAARRSVGVVPDFSMEDFTETRWDYLDPQARCAVAAGVMALDSAAVQRDDVESARRGLSFATMFGALETQALLQKTMDEQGTCSGSAELFRHSCPSSTSSALAAEFALRGWHLNFCGGLLCGAQALEAAALAIRSGKADLVLAGGADVVGMHLLDRLRGSPSADAPAPAQGASLLVLESQDSVEAREGYAFCELGAVVCVGTEGPGAAALARSLEEALGRAMDEASVWEGDIGVICVSSGGTRHSIAAEAEGNLLERFSQVPRHGAKRFVGETFAAGFPLDCTMAADVLNSGFARPDITFHGSSQGVEFWVERQPEPLLGSAALVIGCTDGLAAAAILRAL
ncbi:MAG: beta-ketoacyl synthase N-terminal-like domain-containing protein [Planctomycetota bacterium]|jgi:3-oxoacyl-[acyl-carrier-protein] synthase II